MPRRVFRGRHLLLRLSHRAFAILCHPRLRVRKRLRLCLRLRLRLAVLAPLSVSVARQSRGVGVLLGQDIRLSRQRRPDLPCCVHAGLGIGQGFQFHIF